MEKHRSNTQQEKKTSSKRCSCCGEFKPLDQFNKASKEKDGLQWYCKPCAQEKSQKHFHDSPEFHILGGMKGRSKKRGFDEVEWTIEEVKEKINGCCEVTGIPFDNERSTQENHMGSAFIASPDRIDNSKGYTKDNTRWVVWIFNQMCGNFSDEQIKQFIEHLRNNEINL